MNYLGIDYGEKRIGLAKSAGGTDRAIARGTIENDEEALKKITKICENEGVTQIIIGDSKDFSGKDNEIMRQIRLFQEALERDGFTTTLIPEHLSTAQARRQPEAGRRVDGSAAAIILQTFLDTKNNDEL